MSEADSFTSTPVGLRARFNELTVRYPNLGRIVGNVGWLTFDKVGRMGLSVIVGAIVARYLGPGGFGQLNYAVALGFLFITPAYLGLDGLLPRELIKFPERRNALLGTAFVLKFVMGLLVYLALLAWTYSSSGDLVTQGLVAIVGGTLITQALMTPNFWFQAELQNKLSVIAASIAFAISSVLKIFLVVQHAHLLWFAVPYLFEPLLTGLLSFHIYSRRHHDLRQWTYVGDTAKKLLREAWPLILSSVATMIYMKIDQIMLGVMYSEAEVGIYSVVVRLSEVWYILPVILSQALFPSIVRSRSGDPASYIARLRNYYLLNAGLAYALFIMVCLLCHPVIQILYGASYTAAEPILRLHLCAGIFVFLGVARFQYLVAEGFVKFSLWSSAGGAVLNIALNYWLIPTMGGMGAAIATVASYALSSVVSSFFWNKTIPTGWLQVEALFLRLIPVPKIVLPRHEEEQR